MAIQLTNEDIKKHNGLVYKLARECIKRVKDPSIDFDDLLSEGYFALMKAYEGYDPTKGFAFSTYAFRTVSGRLRSFIDRKGNQIRYPAHIVLVGNRIRNQLLNEEQPHVIAESLGCTEELATLGLEYLRVRQTVSMDKPVGNDSDSDHWNKAGHEDDYSGMLVEEFLETLSPMNREVLKMIMNGSNYREIAKHFGVSHQAIWMRVQKMKVLYTQFQAESEEVLA